MANSPLPYTLTHMAKYDELADPEESSGCG